MVITTLMHEFIDLHDQLRHIPFPIMFKLRKEGKLDKKFLALQDIKLLCHSCMFVQCKNISWHKETHPAGNVRNPSKTDPGDKFHLDQMQSAQPGLVP